MKRHGPDWDATLRDASLDMYRGAMAELRERGRLEAYLAVRVEPMATRAGGHLWWARWSVPHESVEWLQTHVDEAGAIVDERDGYVPANSPWLTQLREGRTLDHTVDGRDVVYDVVWLTGSERDVAWARFGFSGGDASGAKPGGSQSAGQ